MDSAVHQLLSSLECSLGNNQAVKAHNVPERQNLKMFPFFLICEMFGESTEIQVLGRNTVGMALL